MRKALIALILALIAAFGGVCYAGASIHRERDQVRFAETALYGDPAAVEGVTVEYGVQNQQKLFWDIRYTAGTPEAEADYAYYPFVQDIPDSRQHDGVRLNNDAGADRDFMEKAPEELTGIEIAYRELYEEAPPGEEVGRIIRLGDYYTYYPIEAMHDLPGVPRTRETLEEAEEENQYFEDFFRIPVLPDEMLEIHVEKHPDGRSHSMGSGTVMEGDRIYLEVYNAIGSDACYFTFRTRSQNGVIVDTGRIPGGYGIYRLPYGEGKITPEALKMVFPLDPGVRVDGLRLSPNETELLLFTMEDNANLLTVIDLATMTETQRIRIIDYTAYGKIHYMPGQEDPVPGDDYLMVELTDVYQKDNFMVLRYGGGNLALLTRDGAGRYVLEFLTKVANGALPHHYPTLMHQGADWDGERLILCSQMHGASGERFPSSFVLSVYDAAGLLYAGEYRCSLDTGWDPDDWGNYRGFFLEHAPYRVRWSDQGVFLKSGR